MRVRIWTKLDAEILAERSHLDSPGALLISSPERLYDLVVMASPGSAVVEGQTIMELADCNNRSSSLNFRNGNWRSIKSAIVADYSAGWRERLAEGRVRRVPPGGALPQRAVTKSFFAAAVPDPKEHYIAVEIAMSEDSKLIEVNRSCDIGRLAEVRLERHALELISWLTQPWDKTAKLRRRIETQRRYRAAVTQMYNA